VNDDPDFEQLDRRLARVEHGVKQLADVAARSAASSHGTALSQPTAPDADIDDVAADAEELVRWVQWFVGRYEIQDLPDCWAQHGALVEELDAMRQGWLETIGQGRGGIAAIQWHDAVGRALDRMRGLWRTCVDGTHRPKMLSEWVYASPDDVTKPDLMDRYGFRPDTED
jgi:hypothetical protein